MDRFILHIYRYNKNGLLEQIGTDKVVDPREIIHDSKQEIIFVGDGAIKYAGIISNTKNKKINIASAAQQYIRASSVGILGHRKI